MKISVLRTVAAAGLLAVSAWGTFAQQPGQTPGAGQDGAATNEAPQAGEKGHGRHRRHGHRGMKMFGGLNLTPEQRERMQALGVGSQEERTEFRALMKQKRDNSITPEGEARLQALRQAQQQRRQEMMNVLTPEQRAQLQQRHRERREKFDRMRGQENQGQTPQS